MVQPCARAALADTRVTLTAREQEIILHIAQGAQNDGIAYEMGISANTVKTHIGNIMRKYRLQNRTQIAITFALEAAAPSPRRAMFDADGFSEATLEPAPIPGRRSRLHPVPE